MGSAESRDIIESLALLLWRRLRFSLGAFGSARTLAQELTSQVGSRGVQRQKRARLLEDVSSCLLSLLCSYNLAKFA